jgi:hypothetical protein
MKRLFALRDSRGQLVRNEDNKQPMYFSDKDSARRYRSKLTSEVNVYFVTYGVDHRNYKGNQNASHSA